MTTKLILLLSCACGICAFGAPGALDLSFNGSGKVITDFGGGIERAHGIVVQADGKIVVAGNSGILDDGIYDFALALYHANGSLDLSFNGTGKVTTAIGAGTDSARGIAVQHDGKIVAAGFSVISDRDRFAVVRYNTDGSLDTSFGGTGKVLTAVVGDNGMALCVAVQNDGKILVAGSSSGNFAVVRYDPNGSLDTSFNGTGKVTTDFGGTAEAVTVQSDGKIVVAGGANNGTSNFALARYNSDGSLDSSFSGDGKLTTAIGSFS